MFRLTEKLISHTPYIVAGALIEDVEEGAVVAEAHEVRAAAIVLGRRPVVAAGPATGIKCGAIICGIN